MKKRRNARKSHCRIVSFDTRQGPVEFRACKGRKRSHGHRAGSRTDSMAERLDYHTKAYSQYGASIGRHTGGVDANTTEKLHLRRVPIDRGGYDPGGAYWGTGAPLWYVYDDEGQEEYFRARDRVAAKAKFPRARWYR